MNHEFDWDGVEILDEERNLSKRLMSEMLYIKRQKNGLNLQIETERLQHKYANIVENFSNIYFQRHFMFLLTSTRLFLAYRTNMLFVVSAYSSF